MKLKLLGLKEVNRIAKEVNSGAKILQRGILQVMDNSLSVLKLEIIRNIQRKLKRRTGTLQNSIEYSIIGADKKIIGLVGTRGVPYAPVHEFGAEIVPKKAKYLTIPIGDNRRRDGLPRIRTKDIDAPFFVKKHGTLFMGGRDEGILFVLKKKITVPPRPYIQPAIDKHRENIYKRFSALLEKVIRGKAK